MVKVATVCMAMGVLMGGCGGGSPAPPTVHQLLNGSAQRVPSGERFRMLLGDLPVGSTVTYDIVDMPTGIGADTMSFVVATTENAVQPIPIDGYGLRSHVSSTGATTPGLPAGGYALVAFCENSIDECFFTATVAATY